MPTSCLPTHPACTVPHLFSSMLTLQLKQTYWALHTYRTFLCRVVTCVQNPVDSKIKQAAAGDVRRNNAMCGLINPCNNCSFSLPVSPVHMHHAGEHSHMLMTMYSSTSAVLSSYMSKHASCESRSVTQSLLGGHCPIVAAYLDLTKAYDRVSQPTLISILNLACFPQSMVNLVSSLYTDVACTVRTSCGYTPLLRQRVGLGQGCPLSPTLFNVYIAVTSEYMDVHAPLVGVQVGTQSLLKAIFYADDIVLLASSSESLQSLVSALEIVCSLLNMYINPAKGTSAVLHFSASPVTPIPDVTCSAGPIHVENKYCYLGIIFSSDLSWDCALEC